MKIEIVEHSKWTYRMTVFMSLLIIAILVLDFPSPWWFLISHCILLLICAGMLRSSYRHGVGWNG